MEAHRPSEARRYRIISGNRCIVSFLSIGSVRDRAWIGCPSCTPFKPPCTGPAWLLSMASVLVVPDLHGSMCCLLLALSTFLGSSCCCCCGGYCCEKPVRFDGDSKGRSPGKNIFDGNSQGSALARKGPNDTNTSNRSAPQSHL